MSKENKSSSIIIKSYKKPMLSGLSENNMKEFTVDKRILIINKIILLMLLTETLELVTSTTWLGEVWLPILV